MYKINGKNAFTDHLSLEEKKYSEDVERYGEVIANANKERQEDILQNIDGNLDEKMTLDEILNIRYFDDFDKSSNTELHFEPEEDDEGKIVIDEENKSIKFIDKNTGKIIVKHYK